LLSETEEDKCCGICLDDMKNALCLPCGHKFHDECITGWIKTKGTCPTCLQQVFNKNTTDLHNIAKLNNVNDHETIHNSHIHQLGEIL
jgi:hypothetical protein